jgi:hypothetical protein
VKVWFGAGVFLLPVRKSQTLNDFIHCCLAEVKQMTTPIQNVVIFTIRGGGAFYDPEGAFQLQLDEDRLLSGAGFGSVLGNPG